MQNSLEIFFSSVLKKLYFLKETKNREIISQHFENFCNEGGMNLSCEGVTWVDHQDCHVTSCTKTIQIQSRRYYIDTTSDSSSRRQGKKRPLLSGLSVSNRNERKIHRETSRSHY
jgi:hypothetical protein